jgi:predicted esterase
VRLLRLVLSLAGVLLALGGAITAAIYLWANGLTAGALVLSTLPLLGALAALGGTRPSMRRRALLAALLLVAVDLAWTAARIARPGGEGLRVCVDTECGGRGAFWQRVPDEREAARAGLYVSRLAGVVSEREFHAFDRVLDDEYARLPDAWRGLPNALLMRSSPARIESHRWVPPLAAGDKAPCIVFLHGFGGALTPYLRAMVESEIGKRFVIVAPALDNQGVWSSERGLAVLERLVSELPSEVDRSRVYLVGLSNGSIAATTVLSRPELMARFKGAVLISGVGPVDDHAAITRSRVLMLAGTRDARFPYAWVTRQADALRSAGADVELAGLDADHYLILTHAQEWTTRFVVWAFSR